MSNRSGGAAARIHEPLDQDERTPHTVGPAPFDPVEADFFARGDAGVTEPPIYLPVDSFLFPLAGFAFLAALTLLALH